MTVNYILMEGEEEREIFASFKELYFYNLYAYPIGADTWSKETDKPATHSWDVETCRLVKL